MIFRLIVIAVLIYLFIRISRQILDKLRQAIPRNPNSRFEEQPKKTRHFDHIKDAEFEDISDSNSTKDQSKS